MKKKPPLRRISHGTGTGTGKWQNMAGAGAGAEIMDKGGAGAEKNNFGGTAIPVLTVNDSLCN